MRRPTSPPPMEFFDLRRAPAGTRALAIEMGGLRVEIEGLDEGLAGRLAERYGPYAVDPSGGADALRVTLALDEVDYYIDPPRIAEMNRVVVAFDPGRVRFLGYRLAGWFETHAGRGQIVLAKGTFEPDVRAIENYVRAAVAWQAVSRGGALVHSAGAVRDGRAFLFYGASGAGKSTLSACSTRGRVVSDDLSLVLPGHEGRLDLVGSPFRGTYTGGPPVQGRFPLAAGFRIVKAPKAEVRAIPRVKAFAALIANLPWIIEAFPRHPELFARIESAFSRLPLYELDFRKDDSYWDAIARAGI